MLWCPLRLPHGHDDRFVFTPSCLCKGLCLSLLFAHSYLQNVVSSYVFMFWVPFLWCPLRFPHKTMFATSLSPVVRRRILIYVLCMLFVFVCVQWCPTRIVMAIWITWWAFHKMQELLTLSEHMASPMDYLVGSVLLIFLVFCVVLRCYFGFVSLPSSCVLCVQWC